MFEAYAYEATTSLAVFAIHRAGCEEMQRAAFAAHRPQLQGRFDTFDEALAALLDGEAFENGLDMSSVEVCACCRR